MKVHVITIATHNEGYLNILKESCERYGLELTILGFGEKWGGFTWRMLKIREYLQHNTDDEDIIIIVDGYDTIFLADKNYIINNFLSYNTNILISVDSVPPTRLTKMLLSKVFASCEGQNISAGLYMGYVKYVKQFLDILCGDGKCLDSNSDDQRLIIELCRSDNIFFKENVKLDADNKVFYNTSAFYLNSQFFNNKDVRIDNNLLINKKTNDRIAIVGGPGNADMSKLIDAYKFNSPHKRRNIVFDGINRFKIYHKYFKIEIYVLSVILLVILFLIFRRK